MHRARTQPDDVALPPDVLDLIGGTPLIALPTLSADLPVPVLLKCEYLNPGGSVKDRIAKAIVEDAEARGLLGGGQRTVVEATAGNTGVGLAIVCARRGYRLVCVMPRKMSADKRTALAALGAEVVIAPDEPLTHPDNFRNQAARIARERGAFLTDQFANPANLRIHEETTGPEIWNQTAGRIGAFVSGSGTGGTISGVGRFLKRMRADIRVVLADPVGSGLADWVRTGTPGPSGSYGVEGIGSAEPPVNLDGTVIDSAEVVTDAESYATARRLIVEEGVLVGGSTGTNVAAALRVAGRGDVDGPVVTLGCDGWDRYRSQAWLQPH